MIQAAHIAAEPLRNANNRQHFISITSSAGRCDRALWLSSGLEANGLDWNETAVSQNSTIALRFHPASSLVAAFVVFGKHRKARHVGAKPQS